MNPVSELADSPVRLIFQKYLRGANYDPGVASTAVNKTERSRISLGAKGLEFFLAGLPQPLRRPLWTGFAPCEHAGLRTKPFSGLTSSLQKVTSRAAPIPYGLHFLPEAAFTPQCPPPPFCLHRSPDLGKLS